MTYTRKTRDVYELQANHGHGEGWEVETTEETRKLAIAQVKCYRENVPGIDIRIVKRRERLALTGAHA